MKIRRIAAALVVATSLAAGIGSAAVASPHGGLAGGHHQRGKGPGGPSTTTSTTVNPTTSTTEVEVEDGPAHA